MPPLRENEKGHPHVGSTHLCRHKSVQTASLLVLCSFNGCTDSPLLSHTGTMRAVRRHVFPGDSAAGQGIVWEWQNDEGGWSPYEMNVCVFLEQAHATNHQRVELGPLGYNYEIDLVALVQTNKTTRFRRSVQRRLDAPYPVTTSTTPLHTGVGCSCQQCWPNSGTGPITTRYRHSMTNFPNSSTTHQVPGRTASVSSSNVGFVPYNKPALTGARSTPRLSAQNALVLAQTGSLSAALAASNGVRYRS